MKYKLGTEMRNFMATFILVASFLFAGTELEKGNALVFAYLSIFGIFALLLLLDSVSRGEQ